MTLLDEVDKLDALDGVTEDDLLLAKKSRAVGDALLFEHGAVARAARGLVVGQCGDGVLRRIPRAAQPRDPAGPGALCPHVRGRQAVGDRHACRAGRRGPAGRLDALRRQQERRAMIVTLCVLLLAAAQAPAHQTPDTVTLAYDASGVQVIQRVNRATDVVAVRLYLLGGTRQLTPATAGIETLLLEASAHGTTAYPGDEATRAMARTGSEVVLEPGADWTVFGFVGLAGEFTPSCDRFCRPAHTSDTVGRCGPAGAGATARRRAGHATPIPTTDSRCWRIRRASRATPTPSTPRARTDSLRRLTATDLKAYLHDQMVRSRLLPWSSVRTARHAGGGDTADSRLAPGRRISMDAASAGAGRDPSLGALSSGRCPRTMSSAISWGPLRAATSTPRSSWPPTCSRRG